MAPADSDPITNPIADPIIEVVDTDAQSQTVVINATAEGVATVVINRPHRKNAFDAEVIGALHEAFETLEAADGVRVVFVRGAAGTFSAGADLDWMRRAASLSEADNREDAMAMARMLHRLYALPMLTVALVEGAAFGGGAGIAESSFHHFADYNWDTRSGCPSFVTERPGEGMQRVPEALADTHRYALNVAAWLSGRRN